MTDTVEHTGSGFVVRNAAGAVTATVVVSTGPNPGEGSLLVMAGALSVEIPLDVEGLEHGHLVFRKNYTAALFALTAAGEPRVPRRTGIPSVVSPEA